LPATPGPEMTSRTFSRPLTLGRQTNPRLAVRLPRPIAIGAPALPGLPAINRTSRMAGGINRDPRRPKAARAFSGYQVESTALAVRVLGHALLVVPASLYVPQVGQSSPGEFPPR